MFCLHVCVTISLAQGTLNEICQANFLSTQIGKQKALGNSTDPNIACLETPCVPMEFLEVLLDILSV